jgi:cellulose synthase (UDP-forming)
LRRNPRVPAEFKASIRLPNGRSVACKTKDFSQTGFGLLVPVAANLPVNAQVQVSVFHDGHESVFPGKTTFRNNENVGIVLDKMTMEQQALLAQMTFSRADMWSGTWGNNRIDRPLESLQEVLDVGWRGCILAFKQTKYLPKAGWRRLKSRWVVQRPATETK